LFGRLQTDCGYTPAQICEMTLDDVAPLFAYWRRYPPLRDLVAAFIGFKPSEPEEEKGRQLGANDMRRLMAATGGKIPGMGGI
jgi:hypothetical protein